MINTTYKSNAEIDGGSAINSKSWGGSFGINGCSTCFKISCCFCWAAAVTDNFAIANGRPAGSCPVKIRKNYLKLKWYTEVPTNNLLLTEISTIRSRIFVVIVLEA